MKKPTVLFLLILILAAIAASLILWRFFIYKSPSPSVPAPTITPIPTPTKIILPTPTFPIKEGIGESPTDILESLKERFPLLEFLPYETNDFSADYIAPLHLQVKIKNATFSAQIKQNVLSWIESKKVDPLTHKIDWVILEP